MSDLAPSASPDVTTAARSDAHPASRSTAQFGVIVFLASDVMMFAPFFAALAEYATLPFTADDHTYGSIYWLLTGLHAAHVTAGLVAMALLVVFRRQTAPLTGVDVGLIDPLAHRLDAVTELPGYVEDFLSSPTAVETSPRRPAAQPAHVADATGGRDHGAVLSTSRVRSPSWTSDRR